MRRAYRFAVVLAALVGAACDSPTAPASSADTRAAGPSEGVAEPSVRPEVPAPTPEPREPALPADVGTADSSAPYFTRLFGKQEIVCATAADGRATCWGVEDSVSPTIDTRHFTVTPPAGFRVVNVYGTTYFAARGSELRVEPLPPFARDRETMHYVRTGAIRLPADAHEVVDVAYQASVGLVTTSRGVWGVRGRDGQQAFDACPVNVGVRLSSPFAASHDVVVGSGHVFQLERNRETRRLPCAASEPLAWRERLNGTDDPVILAATGSAGDIAVVTRSGALWHLRDVVPRHIQDFSASAPVAIDLGANSLCVLLTSRELHCQRIGDPAPRLVSTDVSAFVASLARICFARGSTVTCEGPDRVRRTMPR